ncbi:hypothetical protein I3842_09G202800 [Carya illinoinensis]|uniref:Uncharacterized protein n=1 Tax=Carya illinoinensis TaxID=32201 RepID=A0A922J903_CARIL|nr:hypothetical protein I3842_09G202800 [Carya illinoinensis]
MAQFILLFLILADAFVFLSMASERAQTMVQTNAAPSSNTPASSPSNKGGDSYNAEAPMIRKLGKHQPEVAKSYTAPGLSPSEKMQSLEAASSSIQTAPIGTKSEENGSVQRQEILLRKHSQHHSVDKSVAGGGVILGGLATTFLVAVFCYIRATGRHKTETVA